MIKIPSTNKQWLKANNSDLYGNISVTRNISFDEEGYLKLSNASKAGYSEAIDANFDMCPTIMYNGDLGEFLLLSTDEPFRLETDLLGSIPTQDVGANNPNVSFEGDAVWFTDKMIVSESTNVVYYDSGTNAWVDTNVTLSDPSFSNHRHCVENFRSTSSWAVADVNTVKTYTTISATPTAGTVLTITSDLAITCMVYFNQNLYIGTQNPYGGDSFMYVWSGTGTAAQAVFRVDAEQIYDMCVFEDSVVLFASNGALLRFNGSGFTMLDALPIFYTPQIVNTLYKNCLKANGDVLYLNVSNNGNSKRNLTNQPDGIWCYDPKVGLYHKYSPSISFVRVETINTTEVDTGTDQITVDSSWATGTEVYFRAGGSPTLGGLTNETKYFVIRVDATHIKLATTRANALANTAIDLTGTGNISQELVFFPNTDYGQIITGDRSLAILPINIQIQNEQYGEEIIWSSELRTRASVTSIGYYGTTTAYVESRGYFITPKFFSEGVTNAYNKIYLKYAPLQTELDKIIIKYRVIDDGRDTVDLSDTNNYAITWTSSTTFTTTQTNWSGAVVGDEVEVVSGAGSGLLAHITTIANNAGTYTVTLDDTFFDYVSGDTGRAIFRNWTKIATLTSSDTVGYYETPVAKVGKFIQVKVELRGLGIKIEEIQIIDSVFKPSA